MAKSKLLSPIGTVFKYRDVTLKVVYHTHCFECYFYDTSFRRCKFRSYKKFKGVHLLSITVSSFPCSSLEREDHKETMYIVVK